ncbi:MAG: arginine--tRNA ligase [Thermoguttaceae bacterium]
MILQILRDRFHAALTELTELPESFLELIRPSQDPKFGDFQANMAMSLGKKLGKSPRDVAAEIVARLQIDDLAYSPEIAGPGFINLRIRETALAELLQNALCDVDRLAVAELPLHQQRRILIDYSAPNVAKSMHVGHIRSTVIGHSLTRVLRFLGHEVMTDNHIGDWGTQFGMILYGYKHFRDEKAFETEPVQELSRLYRLVRQMMDNPELPDPLGQKVPENIKEQVLEETAKLHNGNEENLVLWNRFLPICLIEIQGIYDRLGIHFDHTLGESYYQSRLAPLVEGLVRAGIATETEGAIGIFLDGQEVPMLIRKKDGAFLYSTTDLATIQYRMEQFQPDIILYVVDFRQSHHFTQLFGAIARIRETDPELLSVQKEVDFPELLHVKFGTVLGEDGKPFKTRSGETVGLELLLDEAEHRAFQVITANEESKTDEGNRLNEEERKETARRIGLGALIYADLSQNRESDYVFSFDKMLAMNGNTATYMQYAYARVCSIFTRGQIDPALIRTTSDPIQLDTPEERTLALELLKFDDALESVARDYRPNHLTAYLFELANRYSNFFEHCPVLRAENSTTRISRLKLCDLTARTIKKGLELLGIETVEQM